MLGAAGAGRPVWPLLEGNLANQLETIFVATLLYRRGPGFCKCTKCVSPPQRLENAVLESITCFLKNLIPFTGALLLRSRRRRIYVTELFHNNGTSFRHVLRIDTRHPRPWPDADLRRLAHEDVSCGIHFPVKGNIVNTGEWILMFHVYKEKTVIPSLRSMTSSDFFDHVLIVSRGWSQQEKNHTHRISPLVVLGAYWPTNVWLNYNAKYGHWLSPQICYERILSLNFIGWYIFKYRSAYSRG